MLTIQCPSCNTEASLSLLEETPTPFSATVQLMSLRLVSEPHADIPTPGFPNTAQFMNVVSATGQEDLQALPLEAPSSPFAASMQLTRSGLESSLL